MYINKVHINVTIQNEYNLNIIIEYYTIKNKKWCANCSIPLKTLNWSLFSLSSLLPCYNQQHTAMLTIFCFYARFEGLLQIGSDLQYGICWGIPSYCYCALSSNSIQTADVCGTTAGASAPSDPSSSCCPGAWASWLLGLSLAAAEVIIFKSLINRSGITEGYLLKPGVKCSSFW